MQPADFLIERADLVATCAGPAPRRGRAQADISPLTGATVAAHQGVSIYIGPAAELTSAVHVLPGATQVGARGCGRPAFVDAVTVNGTPVDLSRVGFPVIRISSHADGSYIRDSAS